MVKRCHLNTKNNLNDYDSILNDKRQRHILHSVCYAALDGVGWYEFCYLQQILMLKKIVKEGIILIKTNRVWYFKINEFCMNARLGQIWKTLYFQLFLGRPCIYKPKKCHSSTQKSNPRPGAWLEEASLDQSEPSMASPGLWLVQTSNFKASSGLGFWLLWWTMQLFRLTYTGSSQK